MTKNSVNNSASDLNCFYRSYTLEFGMENFLAHGMKQVLYLFLKQGDDLSDCDNYRGISLINPQWCGLFFQVHGGLMEKE